jgi:hypothetical protein
MYDTPHRCKAQYCSSAFMPSEAGRATQAGSCGRETKELGDCLLASARANWIDVITVCLETRGASPNARLGPRSRTPLMIAAAVGAGAIGENGGVAKLLLERGADVNSSDADGLTALMFAAAGRAWLTGNNLRQERALVAQDEVRCPRQCFRAGCCHSPLPVMQAEAQAARRIPGRSMLYCHPSDRI